MVIWPQLLRGNLGHMETDRWHPLRGGWSQLQDLVEFEWCRTFILLSCFLCPSTDNRVFLVVCWAQGLLSRLALIRCPKWTTRMTRQLSLPRLTLWMGHIPWWLTESWVIVDCAWFGRVWELHNPPDSDSSFATKQIVQLVQRCLNHFWCWVLLVLCLTACVCLFPRVCWQKNYYRPVVVPLFWGYSGSAQLSACFGIQSWLNLLIFRFSIRSLFTHVRPYDILIYR